MAKKITAVVKLQLPAGKATPGPPVGSTLGPHGINIAGFTKEFNEKTSKDAGLIIPVIITIYQLREIATIKMPDLNAANIDTAMSMIAGTARSMGVLVEE